MVSTGSLAPERIARSATIVLDDSIEKVFPLFGPIREGDWADGWQPEILFGKSQAEERMIFRTRSRFDDEDFYIWVITKFSPDLHLIEYTVSAKERVWFITIECTQLDTNKTKAIITYTYTGMTEEAIKKNRESLERIFAEGLSDWQESLNYYLRTGEKLGQ
jgi:hypothetical protein